MITPEDTNFRHKLHEMGLLFTVGPRNLHWITAKDWQNLHPELRYTDLLETRNDFKDLHYILENDLSNPRLDLRETLYFAFEHLIDPVLGNTFDDIGLKHELKLRLKSSNEALYTALTGFPTYGPGYLLDALDGALFFDLEVSRQAHISDVLLDVGYLPVEGLCSPLTT